MPDARLLIIDDDRELCAMLVEYLGKEGMQTECVHDGEEALGVVEDSDWDAIVLDVMLPGRNGLDVLREVRKSSAVPVLMLTARGDDVDRIVGLEIGADDYLPKPFNPRELVARLRAILRRTRNADTSGRESLVAGDLALDPGTYSATVAGEPVKVTAAEFRVLQSLVSRAGQVVSKDTLAQEALGRRLTAYDRSIDVHVSHLRKKLGPSADGEPRIRSIRGAGYLLPTVGAPARNGA